MQSLQTTCVKSGGNCQSCKHLNRDFELQWIQGFIFPKFPASCNHSGQYNGPSEEPEIIFADMLRARMVLGSEVTLVGDKSSN